MTLGISDEEFENAIDEAARARRIDLAHAKAFTTGPVDVIPSLRTIRGPDGEAVIEPKVMQVLIALAQRCDNQDNAILSRDDLIERCWEGRVVGESSINRVISLLRSALKSVSGQCVSVENVPKVGYRLWFAPDWEPAPSPAKESQTLAPTVATDTSEPGTDRAGSVVLAAGLAALLAIVAAAYALWPSASSVPVERLKVAMLPLKAGDGVDPLYARGLEEELRSQLARVGRFEVTSSESARQLFEQGLSADEICRKLGADYAWVGTLNVEADRVTLAARLIDAANEGDAFSDTLSSAPGAAQTLPLRTARAITTALGRPVANRLSDTPVAASDFRLYLTALGLIETRGDAQRIAALEILEEVTQRNPQFADGWAGLAKALFLLPFTDPPEKAANRLRADQVARKALDLDPDTLDALKILGMLDSVAPDQRLAYLKRATDLDPGDPEAWFWRSMTQEEFALQAEDPVASAAKVVAIDPLWAGSWLSSELAASFGRLDEARAFEESIAQAAVTPSTRLMAQARRAQMDGDLSRFVALTRQAQRTQTETERRFGSKVPLMMAQRLLDLPVPSQPDMAMEPKSNLYRRLADGVLPPRSDLRREGLAGAAFWENSDMIGQGLPLFLRDGREAELAAYYDAAFENRDAFLRMASADGRAHTFIPSVSPYLALAFRELGRGDDAAWHIAQARAQLDRWKQAETGSIYPVIFELMLAAVEGNTSRAAAMAQRLPEFGWPYSMAHNTPTTISLLRDDPLFDTIRELPQVRAVLDPIRANLAKEREEVLALGV